MNNTTIEKREKHKKFFAMLTGIGLWTYIIALITNDSNSNCVIKNIKEVKTYFKEVKNFKYVLKEIINNIF